MMSGGHYEYGYSKLDILADDIEKDFIDDGKYMTDDWSFVAAEGPELDYRRGGKRPLIEADRIGDAADEQRPIILAEVKSLIADLRKCAKRSKELEWYMSGDTGASSYLKRLKDVNLL